MFNASAFFDDIRNSLFHHHMNQHQVDGINILSHAAHEYDLSDEQLAYVLATAFHETARTMQPIKEFGFGRGRKYGKPDPETGEIYAGRGYVQCTWKRNYQAMSDKLGVDLIHSPDLALDEEIAAKIAIQGMLDGTFTGRKLSDYISGDKVDFVHARRIINGMDRANKIAGYAYKFLHAIKEGHKEAEDV